MKDTANLILHTSLGRELSDSQAEELSNVMHSRDLVDGEFLFEEGATDNSLYVLLKGKLEVMKRTSTDGMASLAVLREGDLAGELSFIDSEAHSVGLRALCDSQVLTLKRKDFEVMVDKDPQIVYKVMRAVARSAHRIVHGMNYESIELSNYIFKQHGRY